MSSIFDARRVTNYTNGSSKALACVKIDTYGVGMTDFRDWYKSVTGKRITADEIAEALNLSRATATRRLTEGKITADDIINLCRKLDVEPVMALVDLGKLTHAEVFDFMESDGTLLATASEEQLTYQLAEITLSKSDKLRLVRDFIENDELEHRRSNRHTPSVEPPLYAVADSSPDEDALREQEEGDAD